MTPKVCLNMIVKNEAKNLPRLFNSIKNIVDDYVIIDTGSTDDTKDLIKKYWDNLNIKGHIEDIPFKNFGHNRTEALTIAKKKSNSEYFLLLDADMIIIDNGFKKEELNNKEVVMLKQKNQFIEWYNTRIVKANIDIRCVGVTHEYYDIKSAICEKLDSLYIEDIGDGGCKEDKYERDIRLLEQGIKDEPENNRYYFYLAQSYRDTNNLDKAIEFYKKHIEMPGWDEEIWYSYYMLSSLYLKKNMIKEAEEWAIKGFIFRPKRIEALYSLCQHFRCNKDYEKAYRYYLLAKNIPFPKDDKLFLEYRAYNYGLDYEHSIINFYIPWADKRDGLKSCLNVINKKLDKEHEDSCLNNLNYYLESLKSVNGFKNEIVSPKEIIVDGIKYRAASPSIAKHNGSDLFNIRYVSYSVQSVPLIFHKDRNNTFTTLNYNYNKDSKKIYKMQEIILHPDQHERIDTHIRGIEDLRLFELGGKLKFIGQSAEFKNKNSSMIFNMVLGTYDFKNLNLLIEDIIESPYGTKVEKNWIHLRDGNFVYKWYPLEIGRLNKGKFFLDKKINTPVLFKSMKGSSCGINHKNMIWVLTHYTVDSRKNNELYREYKHCLVILDEDYDLLAYSNPFTFENNKVEYCLGAQINKNKLIICYSKCDAEGSLAEIDLHYFINSLNFFDDARKDCFWKNMNTD